MSVALRILAAGPGVTLQDGGRHGYLRFGVTAAGPMDPLAFATANKAVGAPEGAPAIEVSLGGVELAAEGGSVSVAIAGGAFKVALDGHDVPTPCVVRLAPEGRLSIRAGAEGHPIHHCSRNHSMTSVKRVTAMTSVRSSSTRFRFALMPVRFESTM